MSKEILYHYTSIESLVQILENKSIKFNNLTACDDLDEAESEDLGRIGKYVFVSCWTREEKESIPMWSQYSGNMSGVRIGMKKYPFKLRRIENKYGPPFDSYLNYEKYYNENKMSFALNQPTFVNVEYVEEDSKIKPSIIIDGTIEDLKKFIRGETSRCELSFESIGKYKRTCWDFQQECRYKIFGMPMGIKDMDDPNGKVALEKQKEYVRRILDDSYVPGYQALYIDLDETAIKDMEFVFGPRMNASEKILLKTYLKSIGLENNYRDSSLRIQ